VEQINLNRPELWPLPVPFPAGTMALLLALLVAGLGGLFAYQSWRVEGQRQVLADAQAQRDRIQDKLLKAEQAHKDRRQTLDRLREEVAQLRDRKAAFRQAQRELSQRLRAAGQKGELVRALGRARAEQEGVWLTSFDLQGVAPVRLSLEGRALRPEAIPRYLRAVAAQKAYRGGYFRGLKADTPEEKSSHGEGVLTFQSRATFPVIGPSDQPAGGQSRVEEGS